ncbi:ribosomal protein L35Ae, partial [Teladorsagia circumcincta]
LYVKAVFTGFKRGLRTQSEHTALLKLDGVFNKDDAKFYIGKRAVYLYKAHNKTTSLVYVEIISLDVIMH